MNLLMQMSIFSKRTEQARGQLRWMSLVYNEFFADLISSLRAENGSAVAEGLGIPGEGPFEVKTESGMVHTTYYKNSPASGRPRDFTVEIPIENFQADEGINLHYTLLDPARFVIWNNYVANTPREQYGLILEAFIRASEKHLELRLKRGETTATFDSINASEFNHEFLEIFRDEMNRMKEHRH